MRHADYRHYRLLTTWRLRAPQQGAFDVLIDSERWPDWWPGAESVKQIHAGDGQGAGSVRQYRWKSPLFYSLQFDAVAERIVAPVLLDGRVHGDLEGSARCVLAHCDGITAILFEWDVQTTIGWMNRIAPLTHPLFALNHRLLMERGARGFARRTGYMLLSVEHQELAPRDTDEPLANTQDR